MKKFILQLAILVALSLPVFTQPVSPPDYLRAVHFTFNLSDNSWLLDEIENIDFVDSLPVTSYIYKVNSQNDSTFSARQTYAYNDLKELVSYSSSDYNSENQTWDTSKFITYGYLNKVWVKEVAHTGNIYIQKSNFIDTLSNLIILSYKMQSTSKDGPWDTLNKFVLSYDVQNRLNRTEIYNYDTLVKTFYLRYEYDYSYNDDDSLIETIEFKVENDVKTNFYKTSYQYNSENLLSSMAYYLPEGDSWFLYYSETYKYYPDKKLKLMNSETYSDTNNLVQTQSKFYEYEPTLKTVYDTLSTGDEIRLTRMEYNYPAIVSVLDKISLENMPEAFPNPAAPGENITVSYPDIKNGMASVSITNLQGETVFSGSTSVVDSKMTIAAPNLSSGMYFINILERNGKVNALKLLINN